jgi:transcriptional regulator with XRE-family HTH domain
VSYFSSELSAALKTQGKTQAEIAAALKLAPSVVNRYIKGAHPPSMDFLRGAFTVFDSMTATRLVLAHLRDNIPQEALDKIDLRFSEEPTARVMEETAVYRPEWPPGMEDVFTFLAERCRKRPDLAEILENQYRTEKTIEKYENFNRLSRIVSKDQRSGD